VPAERPAAIVLRNGVAIDDPLGTALGFFRTDAAYRVYDGLPVAADTTISESDIRVANRGGARISAAEVAALLARRAGLEAALRRIPPTASLCDPEDEISWAALADLYRAADGVRGVGLGKLTKFLHKKRPRLVPMLDTVVVRYLRSVDELPPDGTALGELATALTRSFKRDLDPNLAAIRAVQRELAARGVELTECRLLDLFVWEHAGPSGAAS
jgi:hypothetical protein